jgi:hypothetical protein
MIETNQQPQVVTKPKRQRKMDTSNTSLSARLDVLQKQVEDMTTRISINNAISSIDLRAKQNTRIRNLYINNHGGNIQQFVSSDAFKNSIPNNFTGNMTIKLYQNNAYSIYYDEDDEEINDAIEDRILSQS